MLSRLQGSRYLTSRENQFALPIRVKVTSRNIVEPRVFLFSSERIPFVSSDFGRTRRTSLVEIVKVSRDTMNYSCRGDAKLRETFLRRGESLFVYVHVYVCVRTKRVVYSCVDIAGVGKDEGVRRARSRNECGKA